MQHLWKHRAVQACVRGARPGRTGHRGPSPLLSMAAVARSAGPLVLGTTLVAQAAAQSLPCAASADRIALPDTAVPGSAIPAQGLTPPPGGTKFSLIDRYCGPSPDRPAASPARAAQLDLYTTGVRGGMLAEGAPAPLPRQVTRPSPLDELEMEPPSAGRPMEPASRSGTARILALAQTLNDAARRHDIDPLLLHAIAHVESRHNPAAVSHAGARGVMQVMPATARRFGVNDPQRELLSAPINVDVSAAYLKTLQARFGNSLPLVLAAYNAGEGAVQRHGNRVPDYPETRDYVSQVLRAYRALREAIAQRPDQDKP